MIKEALAFYHCVHGADGRFAGEPTTLPSERNLDECEAVLGISLPPSFRHFCLGTPFLSYRFLDVVARDDGEIEMAKVNENFYREDPGEFTLPKHLLVFQPVYDGMFFCFDTSHSGVSGEFPVVHFEIPMNGTADEFPEIVAPSFGDFALNSFRQEWLSRFESIKKRLHQSRMKGSPTNRRR